MPEFYVDVQRPDGDRCSQDVAAAITKLKNENVQGIILICVTMVVARCQKL